MEHPEDYVREFERDFPEHQLTYAERMKLLALFEQSALAGARSKASTLLAGETYGGWL